MENCKEILWVFKYLLYNRLKQKNHMELVEDTFKNVKDYIMTSNLD